MKTELFDYQLPEELIALHPADQRDHSRLLVLGDPTRPLIHARFDELAAHLPAGALLVANDTRVIPARLRGRRPTGGGVEVLLVRPLDDGAEATRWLALTRANRPLKTGDRIDLEGLAAVVEERRDRGETVLSFAADASALAAHVERAGEVPLPPYIKRTTVPADRERYQTVYARHAGSVAAPTAGLHFTPALIEELRSREFDLEFVTLHVGPGTFRPIADDEVDRHEMDAELYDLDPRTIAAIDRARGEGRPVIAIGTTVVRALEGAAAEHDGLRPGPGSTDLFIRPGYELAVVDGLITNFHLPRSTLLCLVSALAGRQRMLEAYAEAVRERYRFYSYGDAMLILPEAR